MARHSPIDELGALRTLVQELRSRLPPMSERQLNDVGMYMLRACWLGSGEPLELVLEPVIYDDPAKPALSLVVDNGFAGASTGSGC